MMMATNSTLLWKITHLPTGEIWTNRGEIHDPAHDNDALYRLAKHRFNQNLNVNVMFMDMDSIAFGVDRETGTRLTAFLIDECGYVDELPHEYFVEVGGSCLVGKMLQE